MSKETKQLRNLTEEERMMVEDNIRLVNFVIHTDFDVHEDSSEYDDMVSIGNFGLIKATQKFNKELNIEFATFAIKCIKNEINMNYYRKRKRKKELINMGKHMEDTIADGNNQTLQDIIEDPKANFVEKIFKQQETIESLEIVLNCLTPRDTIILCNTIAKKVQKEIAEIIGVTQSHVSRRVKKIHSEVQKIVNTTIETKKLFRVTKGEDLYQITFPLGRIGDVEEILSKILSEVQSENLSDLLITHDSNEVTIKMPVNTEGLLMSFAIIAQIYQALYKNYPNFFDEMQ